MPKVSERFDPNAYAPVADRLALFWAAFPNGRIETELVERTAADVLFVARVFRQATDPHPAATGWASERQGDGEVNEAACLENTETSAIGRALANLGFTASRERASAEEMAKVERARTRRAPVYESRQAGASPTSALHGTALQLRADMVNDLLRVLASAQAVGLSASRAERWRVRLLHEQIETKDLARFESRLRDWVRRRTLLLRQARNVQR